MAMIIKERERKTDISYSLYYEWNDLKGAGFSFDCTSEGLLVGKENPEAYENFIDCITGKNDVTYHGIQTYSNSYTEAAVLKCDCGEHVHLHSFTNTCECGSDYNMSGELLADREQWGEETGEHWTEIY